MQQDSLEYLLNRASQGGSFDSSGEFTLSLKRSIDLVGRDFNQLYPGGYLLKLVQCGVGAESEKIVIQTKSREARLQLVGSIPEKLGGKLLEVLSATENLDKSAGLMGYLSRAIWAALAADAERVEWSCFDGKVGETLLVQKDKIELIPITKPPFKGASGSGFYFRMIRPKSLRSKEIKLIKERCGYCPIPLVLNGFLVKSAWKAEKPVKKAEWCQRYHPSGLRLMETYVEAGPRRPRRNTIALTSLEKRDCHTLQGETLRFWRPRSDNVYFHAGPRGRYYRGAISIPIDLEGPARLTLVKLGVCLDTKLVNIDVPGAIVVYSGAELKTDITDMRVVVDQNYHSFVDEIRAEAAALVRNAGQALEELPGSVASSSASKIMYGTSGALLTGAAIVGGSFLTGSGLGLLIVTACYSAPFFSEGKARNTGLWKELGRRLPVLRLKKRT